MNARPSFRDYVRTSLVASTANYALACGVEMDVITSETGLRWQQLSDPDAQISDELLPKIWNLLADPSARMPPTLHMASATSLSGLLGPWSALASYAVNLRAALRALVQFSSVIAGRLQMNLSETMSYCQLELSHQLDSVDGGYSTEMGAATLYRVINEYSHGGAVECVYLAHSPLGTIEAYEHYFQAPVRFGQKCTALVMRRSALEAPMKQVDRTLFRYVQNDLELLSTRWDVSEHLSLLTRVKHTVQMNADGGVFDANTLARRMNMSLRSLQRQLQLAGVTAAQLLEDECEVRARHFLEHTGQSVREIARSLGYSDDRAFRRAFQRWTGQSPTAYRQNRSI